MLRTNSLLVDGEFGQTNQPESLAPREQGMG